ncbi:MAG: phosphoenolpyruvate carboxykinase (GTP), partial [Acidobacteriota bacterium]|nr:phosphoenolpyruvate carboxykinase (GTP) [Acidobacteriota bacterium]
SWMARDQGWMAEHMLILGLEDPSGKVTYMAAAFPSACGKTNLAMMVSALESEGYRVWTIGDDIAWLHIAADGTLRAINPEAGFFGVAPGTNAKTNPNVMAALHHDTIFTNVAMTELREPWWEGMDTEAPNNLIDWRGNSYAGKAPAAHPNSRYTVRASQSASISPKWEDPAGVPISAFIFGGRRARVAPLVYESFDWQHGVFVGATMASETTAAATGAVGVTRRDPMAMLPFCGYNMADYFEHWLEMGSKLKNPPKIFHVNWFRRSADGKFLWPGYGENVRVLKWMLDRIEDRADATETPIGFVPTPRSLTLDGLAISHSTVDELLRVDVNDWVEEDKAVGQFFQKFGNRLPGALRDEHKALGERLSGSSVATR